MATAQRNLVRAVYGELRKVIDLPPDCLEVTIRVAMGEFPTVTATYFPDESKATGEPVTQRFTLTPMEDGGATSSSSEATP